MLNALINVKNSSATNIRSTSVEDKTIKRIVKLWANFVRTENPNSMEDVPWKPVSKDEFILYLYLLF